MSVEQIAKTEYFYSDPLLADKLFCDLSPRAFESLSLIKKTIRKRKGVAILSRRDAPNCLYVLRQGKARLVLNSELDKGHFVRLIERNEILGLTGALANLPFEMYVRTITPCLFEYIPRRAFINFLRDEPEICFRLLKTLGSNYQKSFELFIS